MKNKIKKMAIMAIAAVTMGMTANAQEQGNSDTKRRSSV